MNQHAAKKEIPGLDWKNLLSVPDAKGFVRETGEYPATLLGELAYRFRELYWRTNDHPRPTGSQVAHTAHLVGRLTKELRGTPLPRRTPEELELINYLVTPGRIEALDSTTSWLEGGRYPIRNMVRHCNELYRHRLFSEFGTLYHQNGVRNFGRLKLDDCEEPWFLMKHLANRPMDATAGEDIILVAMSSGDHNEAYRERS